MVKKIDGTTNVTDNLSTRSCTKDSFTEPAKANAVPSFLSSNVVQAMPESGEKMVSKREPGEHRKMWHGFYELDIKS